MDHFHTSKGELHCEAVALSEIAREAGTPVYVYSAATIRHHAKVMKAAKVVDPAEQSARDQVRFGATIELADEDDERRTITIVGDDEADAARGLIGWSAPLARAFIGARVGDERTVRLPAGEKLYEVVAIRYPGAN